MSIISVQWIKWHHMTSSSHICAYAILSLLRVGSFVLSIFSSSLLSENIEIQIYKYVISPVVLYECETLSLTWRKNIDWKHSRTGSCGKFYLKREKVKGGWKQNSEWAALLYVHIRRRRWVGYAQDWREMYTGFQWGNLKAGH